MEITFTLPYLAHLKTRTSNFFYVSCVNWYHNNGSTRNTCGQSWSRFYDQAFLILNATFTPAVMFPCFYSISDTMQRIVFYAQLNSVLMTCNLDLSYIQLQSGWVQSKPFANNAHMRIGFVWHGIFFLDAAEGLVTSSCTLHALKLTHQRSPAESKNPDPNFRKRSSCC